MRWKDSLCFNAAKETSAGPLAAIEAVKTMQDAYSGDIDRRTTFYQSRISQTGWPIVRQDDGIRHPTPPIRLDLPEDPLAPASGIINNGVLLAIPALGFNRVFYLLGG